MLGLHGNYESKNGHCDSFSDNEKTWRRKAVDWGRCPNKVVSGRSGVKVKLAIEGDKKAPFS